MATYSSRSRIIGFTDSARLAGIHVANSPSNAIAHTHQRQRVARSCLIDDKGQYPAGKNSKD